MDKVIQTTQIHGTCVAIDNAAVLLLGPPGSGKSDLALRLIDDGATLIADDRVDLSAEDKSLIATPPQNIAGLIEVRGIGIAKIEHAVEGIVVCVFEMTPPDHIQRLPTPISWKALNCRVPLIRLNPFAASACAKIRLAVRNLEHTTLIDP